jgi:hypothetical protein
MKKSIKIFAMVALFTATLFTSCKKEENLKSGVKPIETLINTKMEFSSYGLYEDNRTMAIVFKSSTAGKITHLGAKLEPGTYNVALLDSSSQSVLKTATVTVSDTSNFAYTDIDDVTIVANKVYYVTINNATTSNNATKKFFSYVLINNLEFPISDGNFTYLEPEFLLSTTNASDIFSDDSYLQNNGILGVPSFIFVEN